MTGSVCSRLHSVFSVEGSQFGTRTTFLLHLCSFYCIDDAILLVLLLLEPKFSLKEFPRGISKVSIHLSIYQVDDR